MMIANMAPFLLRAIGLEATGASPQIWVPYTPDIEIATHPLDRNFPVNEQARRTNLHRRYRIRDAVTFFPIAPLPLPELSNRACEQLYYDVIINRDQGTEDLYTEWVLTAHSSGIITDDELEHFKCIRKYDDDETEDDNFYRQKLNDFLLWAIAVDWCKGIPELDSRWSPRTRFGVAVLTKSSPPRNVQHYFIHIDPWPCRYIRSERALGPAR